jgi:hypothetical protein
MTPISVSPSRPVDGGHVVYAKDQPEYQPLPAWVRQDGRVVTRWRLTWRERLAVLVGRSLYMEVMTFGRPIQPIFPTLSEDEALYAEEAS